MDSRNKQLEITLDNTGAVTLGRQLYERIRDQILSGRLQPGERVMSTRQLSESIGVSRPTVAGSYEQLIQEGYLETRHGSGTFVSTQLPVQSSVAKQDPGTEIHLIRKRLSVLGDRLFQHQQPKPEFPECEIGFYSWRPVISEKQFDEWSRQWWRTAKGADRPTLDYQPDPLGLKSLREAIAGDLEEKRGMRCLPEQIVMVSSLPQAFDLIARLHVDRGDRVAVENPGYPHFRSIALLHGADLVGIGVDGDGIKVDEIEDCSVAGLKLLYVTPSHQVPTGAVLSLPRRLKLLDWAYRNGVLVIEDEDDFETEHCYVGRPIPALRGLDKHDSVIYIGSFANLMAPFISMTYLVVPIGLSPLYSRGRELMGAQLPTASQQGLTEFINQGYLRNHVRKMRDLYDARRKALLAALELHFHGRFWLISHQSGLYVLVRFETKLQSDEIIKKALALGVGLISTAAFYIDGSTKPEFIIGYGDLTEEQIEEGIRRLAKILM